MRLIDADKILEALGVFTDKEHGDPHFLNGIETAREIIEGMPEAVVRCGECKRFKHYEIFRGYTLDLCEEYGGQPRCVELDDYCSHGERSSE